MVNKGNGGHFDLLAPTRAELLQMIRLPAVAANLTWSVDADSATPLDQILCAEAANNPDALPMLQYTLQELYLQRSETDELQVSVYQSLGGIEGAIGKKAEEIYQQLPEEHQPQLATVLSRLVTLSPDGETITSRAARWSELSQASETSFVQAMVNSRLFVSHLQNNEPCFSLAHEALLRRWPRASEWISAHKDSLTIKSRLQQLTERWLKEDKSSAYLLPQGKPLEEALSLQTMPVFTLDSDELALLKASQQKVKAKRWLTRTTITLLCFLTFTAIFMSVKSQQSEAFAQQKRLDAESLLGFMVGEFADKLRSVGRMDLLDGISNKALEYFSQQDTSQTYTSHFQQLQTLAAIGEVAYSRGKSDEAEQGFQTARKLAYQLLQSDSIEPKLLKTAGATEFWLGQLDYDNSRWELARAHYQAYLELSEKMYTLDKEDKDSQFELASAFLTLGALAAKTRKQNHGANYFEKAIEHYSNLAKQYPNDAAISRSSAIAFSWLADAQLQLGQMELAKKNYKLELNTLSTLHQANPDNLDLIRNLANAHNRNAQIFMIDDDNKRAAEHFLSGVRLLTQATSADPANQGWQLNLRKNKLSFLSVTEVDKELEHDTLDSLTQDLLASTPSNTFERRELVRLLILSMRAALRRESAITEQLSRVESEVTILLKNSPEDISFKELRAHIWLIQAQVIQPSERKEICKKAVNFYQSVLQSTNSPSVLAYLKQAETCSFT
jgi:tetratricopeptide (TPR) repeat protein